jgi:hypothetical protein
MAAARGVPEGAWLGKLGAARGRVNSRASREEVGGDPAPRQTRHPRARRAAIYPPLNDVVLVYSNSSSAPKRASSTV